MLYPRSSPHYLQGGPKQARVYLPRNCYNLNKFEDSLLHPISSKRTRDLEFLFISWVPFFHQEGILPFRGNYTANPLRMKSASSHHSHYQNELYHFFVTHLNKINEYICTYIHIRICWNIYADKGWFSFSVFLSISNRNLVLIYRAITVC